MDPAPINQSLGDFLIRGVLGQGGSGIVYDATWGPRRVALKVLHAGYVGTGKERQQFLAEAQRLQQITHPSVVKVLAFGQLPDGRPYLAMERLEGETLAQVLANGPVSVGEALHLFGELCTAVSALHEQGLIHRDLKPENVFVVDRRHAVLLDFGIAKEISAPASTTTQEGGVRGTPAYMAPERFFGQPAAIATDVYELAVMLYAMLAGCLPWESPADPEARLSPRSLAGLAHVPEALDVEVRRALSTRAQNRPASAAALLSAVREAASGVATPAGAPQATARIRSGSTAPPPIAATSGAPLPLQQPTPTPLAWAPTEAVPVTRKGAPRRPWLLYAVPALCVVIAVVSIVALRGSGSSSSKKTTTAPVTIADVGSGSAAGSGSGARAPGAGSDDPWAEKPVEATPEIALSEPVLTAETYRAEAAAAVQRLPPDTRLLITVQVGEIRENDRTARFLDKLAKYTKVRMMADIMPPCVRALVTSSQWLVFGATSLDQADQATLVARGRWKRAEFDACVGAAVEKVQLAEGTRIFKFDDFWLDFIDEHTAYVTNRMDLGAEAIHSLVVHGAGPQGHALQLVAKLPIDRTIAFVDEGRTNDNWEMFALPKGSDLYGWLRVEKDGVSLDLNADAHDPRLARAAVFAAKKQMKDMFETAPEALGKFEIVAEGSVVRTHGKMTTLMLDLLDMALPTL
jgi:serine/threonine protein kinase